MDENLSRPPGNITLGELSQAVFSLLAEFTAFPWPVLKAQAARQRYDPANLRIDQLRELAPRLATGVARFTSPQTGVEVQARLDTLIRTWPRT